AGMDGYLTKPFSLSDIQKSIELHLEALYPDALLDRDVEPHSITSSSVNVESLEEENILNFTAINNIREIEQQTGKQLLPSIFQGYITQMEEKLREIDRNIAACDDIAIYRTAHAIKSMSANIGAEKVRTISA